MSDSPTPAPASSPDLADDDEGAAAISYDPADYRWVPVRRRPRTDGWTEEKQRRFIEVLADTGLVNLAARAVGMSRASAYTLRRSAHGAAFARAWDAARLHAGGLIEDIAFERAIEGTETPLVNREGAAVGVRTVHDNRLLTFLLRHLKPERYGRNASVVVPIPDGCPLAAPGPLLEESLRAMEPALPAPPEQLLDADTLADELILADVADGLLPDFLTEGSPAWRDEKHWIERETARRADQLPSGQAPIRQSR